MTDRIFSVMKKRDDLPEMTFPLALLFLFASALFASAAAKLCSSAPVSGYFDPSGIFGTAAAVLFLPLAACLYSLLILLWRRMLSLLTTPAMFGMMILFGADLFSAVTITVSLLFVSYVFAVSLISRENRFRRLTFLSLSAAVCLVLAFIAWIGLNFGSFGEFIVVFMDEIPRLIAEAAESYIGMAAGESITVDSELFSASARNLLVMFPSYIGVLSIVLAWLTEFLSSLVFRILDCEDVFIKITGRTTLPLSYASVYAVVFVMFMLTGSEQNPMLHAMLRSVLYVMLPPCAAVGVRGLMLFLEDKLYYMTREKVLAAIILFLSLAFLGVFPFLLVTSAVGSAVVIKNALRSKRNGQQ